MPVLNIMSLRLRLTFLSAALGGLALAVIGTVLYIYFESSSYQLLDSELREQTAQVANALNKEQVAQGRGVPLTASSTRLDTPQIYIQLLDADGSVLRWSPNLRQDKLLPVSADT